MQFHVPPGHTHPHGGVSANRDASHGGGLTTSPGVPSASRFAVRVAAPQPPPPTTAAPSRVTVGAINGARGVSVSACASPAAPAAAPAAAPPPHPTGPSMGYGGGLVRISDLRRQGVSSVESGLRLATMNSAPRSRSDDAGGRLAEDTGPVQTRTRRRSPPPPPPAPSSARSTRDAPRRSPPRRSSRGGAARRGRGRRSSGSRESLTLTLRDDGELCEYRWYMARGRRCFVYDGRTYKGSSAHKMWEKVKAAAKEREGAQRPHTFAAAAGAALVAAPHRASTRARTAAAAHAAPAQRRASAAVRAAEAGATSNVAGLVPAHLPEEWQLLMVELGMSPEDSTPMASDVARRAAGAASRQPAVRAAAPRLGGLRTGRRGQPFEEVVEVTDSEEDTGDSNTGTSDGSSASSGERRETDGTTAPVAPLEWPATSYFSDDASSGWSSTSSVAPSPARRASEPATRTSPRPKRARQERSADTLQSSAASTTPARLCNYHGVQAVEHDGWVYPMEVYASQQQQQLQQEVRSAPARAATSSTAAAPSTSVTAATLGSRHDHPLCGVDDLPLGDLYSGAIAYPHTSLSPAPLMTAGLAVVCGGGAAVAARPVSAASASLARHHPPLAAVSACGGCSGGGDAASTFLGADGLLDGLSGDDVADLFVTGEEVGAVRYES
ncbi:hypothetical protein NESM_000574200 [Novymonas esmeraldas]|uniref:AP2/ERF domain-containing protein n=1 Tax=Novymonas esmeraldas TaxID=1808958 RepID=A0AAW0ERN2_9TRYP